MFKNENDFKKLINRLNIDDKPNPAHHQNLRQKMLSTFNKIHKPRKTSWLTIRRIIMKSPITKLAAAAAIIVVGALAITFLQQSATPAYAIEQTIEANHSVRFLHIKNFKAEHDEPKEFWLEFDQYGQFVNARIHTPEWEPHDGPKVTVWAENIAQVWLKKKNVLAIIKDKSVAQHMLNFAKECDPKLAVQRLYEQQAQGEVDIKIDYPLDKAEPIVVTATYLPESSKPDKREVLLVDQATKLVVAMEYHQLKDGQYQYLGVSEYYDYNQPIAPEMFALSDVPADALILDQVTQKIGLAQGNLSDNEIATEVARQFFQALIDKDYHKAGRLYQGIPAEKMQEVYGQIRFIRIVSIGEPTPETTFGKLRVPCTIEIQKNGEMSHWQPHPEGLLVGQIENQPGWWGIFGGI